MAAFGNLAEVSEVLGVIWIGWVYLKYARISSSNNCPLFDVLELFQKGGDTQYGGCGYRKTGKIFSFDPSQQFETVTC